MAIDALEMQRAQLTVLLVALSEFRKIYPISVPDYCAAVLAVAKAAGLPVMDDPETSKKSGRV